MKKSILLTLAILTLLAPTSHAWWWDGDDPKDDEIQQLHDEVDMANEKNDDLTGIIVVLGVGIVVALVVGAAIGSKARRASKEVQEK